MMLELLASYVLFPSVERKNMLDADARTQTAQYPEVANDHGEARELKKVLCSVCCRFIVVLCVFGNNADAEAVMTYPPSRSPAMKQTNAKKLGASATTLPTCHLAMLEGPETIAAVIEQAAKRVLSK